MVVQAYILLQLTALLQQPSYLFLNIPHLFSHWDGVKEDNWDVGKRCLFFCWSQYPRNLLGKRIFLTLSSFELLVDNCVEKFSGWKWRQCEPHSGTLVISKCFLFRFMMVPEGYVGSETAVCFVLTKRSSQICIPEPALSGGLGRESHSCCHVEGSCCDPVLVTFSWQLEQARSL